MSPGTSDKIREGDGGMITGAIDIAGLDGERVSLASEQLSALGSRITGRVLSAGDQGWDDSVFVWNGMVARLPALVVQPVTSLDVAAAVRFAREHRLMLS